MSQTTRPTSAQPARRKRKSCHKELLALREYLETPPLREIVNTPTKNCRNAPTIKKKILYHSVKAGMQKENQLKKMEEKFSERQHVINAEYKLHRKRVVLNEQHAYCEDLFM
jgi:phosphatidate phosphatase PAH1